jgi:DNA-binding response OmpR family regulator
MMLPAPGLDRTLTAPPLRSNAESSLVATFCLLLGLTPSESLAFVKLVKQEHVTGQELHRATSQSDAPVSRITVVNVTVCKLRRKLKPRGIAILNVYGQGYRLDEGSRDKVRTMLADYGEEVGAAAAPPKSKAPKPTSPM